MSKTARLQIVEPVETHKDIALAARQISDKATAEINDLQTHMALLQSTISASQNETETLQHAIAERHRYIAMLRHIHNGQAQKHRDAVNYASVAAKTIGEYAANDAVDATKAMLDRTQADLDREEPLAKEGNIQSQARIDVLQKQLHTDQQELQQCQERAQIVETVRSQSLQTLEEAEFALFTEDHTAHLNKIEAARVALEQAQSEEKQFLDASFARFEAFPPCQYTIKKLMPEDNSTLRVLKSQLKHMDVLLDDGRFMERGLNLSAVSDYYNWHQILCLTSDEIYVDETIGGNPRQLTAHRNKVERLISEYISMKRR